MKKNHIFKVNSTTSHPLSLSFSSSSEGLPRFFPVESPNPFVFFIDFPSIKLNFSGVCMSLLLEWLFCLSFWSVSLCISLFMFGFLRCQICWEWFHWYFWDLESTCQIEAGGNYHKSSPFTSKDGSSVRGLYFRHVYSWYPTRR